MVALSQALSEESEFDKYEKEILQDSMQLEDFSSMHGSSKSSDPPQDGNGDKKEEEEVEERKELSERAGSSKSNIVTFMIRPLMDRIHDHLQIHFLDPLQSIALVLALWRGLAKSNRKRFAVVGSSSMGKSRRIIDCGIRIIDSAWNVFAAGLNVVYYNEVASIRQFLGEVEPMTYISAALQVSYLHFIQRCLFSSSSFLTSTTSTISSSSPS